MKSDDLRSVVVHLWNALAFREHLELWKRRWCRMFGHDWRENGGANSPVIPLIAVCVRCGKFVRLVEPTGKA